MLSRDVRQNKTKIRQRCLTKWQRRRKEKFHDKKRCGKVMKQNEKIDERSGIKESNLQSINCECFPLRIGHQRIDAVVEVNYTTGKWGV